MNKWTNEEVAQLKSLLKEGHTQDYIAGQLNRTQKAVERKIQGLSLTKQKGTPKAASYSEDKAAATEAHWKDQYDALHRKYKQALKDAALTEKLVEEVKEIAPLSYQTAPVVTRPRKRSTGRPQSAVLLLSDTHIGKVTDEGQTLGFSRYNFNTFLNRLKYVEDSVTSILRDHVNTEVPELVIPILGDMLDGALAHGVEGGLRNTLFTQFYAGGHALAQFLRNLSAHVPKIRIHTVVGNHTRYQNQRRMPTENRFSNFDQFLYAYLEALTSDIKNIEWSLNQQPFQIFQIQGFTFHASHGDHWRGGDKALGIPNHAIGRQISTTTQLFSKHGAQCPHYYVTGHLHRSITLPHALGEVMVNGGFPGLDNYSLAENFNPVDPIQRFFFVHPKYGRSATYDLTLKYAEDRGEPPYKVPFDFPVE